MGKITETLEVGHVDYGEFDTFSITVEGTETEISPIEAKKLISELIEFVEKCEPVTYRNCPSCGSGIPTSDGEVAECKCGVSLIWNNGRYDSV